MSKRKIAIVYDWMDSWGGVERLLLTLNEIYPDTDWFTSYIDPNKAEWIGKIRKKIHTSFIQKLPFFIKSSRTLSIALYPVAFESFDFKGYDLVISVTSSFAKGIITRPGTKHVCILLTPTRWLWGMTDLYINSKILNLNSTKSSNFKSQNLITILAQPIINFFRNWDKVSSSRPDKIISISQTIADRCQKYYGRKSVVLYPPFDLNYWTAIKAKIKNNRSKSLSRFKELGLTNEIPKSKYFLLVSRLEAYKMVDIAIRTFNKKKLAKLIIIGKGTQLQKLNKIAGKNIAIIYGLSDAELAYVYSHAQALIMPQEEDFGYVSLEAQFFGCPVIAYHKGGVSESIVEGKTGTFFKYQTEESLSDAVADFKRDKYNLDDTQAILGKFSKEKFVQRIRKICI